MPQKIDSNGDYLSKKYYPDPANVVHPKAIPFRGAIPGGVYDGKMIEITGSVPYGTDAFSVNLLTGLDEYSDRALHVSVRFNGRIVVRNSLEMNQWGSEDRVGIFPFASGKDFTMMILAQSGCFRIAVNGQHCWEFNHRMPLSRVSSILIEGSVHIERIQYIDQGSQYRPVYPTAVCPSFPDVMTPGYPTVCPQPSFPTQPTVCPSGYPAQPTVCPPGYPAQPTVCPPGYPAQPTVCPPPRITPSSYVVPSGQPGYRPTTGSQVIAPPEQICPQPGYFPSGGSSNLAPVYNPAIPYAYPIYGGLKPGMMIYISGRPSASPYRFTLNLQSGTQPYPPPDVAFHLDARFHSHSVVRNSRSNNCWQNEDGYLATAFPFRPACNFDLIIRVDADRFMVALDGRHLLEFGHRLRPLERFDTLYIENDVVVSSIRVA